MLPSMFWASIEQVFDTYSLKFQGRKGESQNYTEIFQNYTEKDVNYTYKKADLFVRFYLFLNIDWYIIFNLPI